MSLFSFLDGKKLGFGFVQFSKVSEANQALEAMNAQPIQGEAFHNDVASNKL